MALLKTVLQAILRKGSLVGILIIVLILLAEVVLWFVAPTPPYQRYEYTFSNEMEKYGLNDTCTFRVDERELRSRPGAEGRETTCRILYVGGEGAYDLLQDVEDTWWGRTAAALEKKYPEISFPVDVKATSGGYGKEVVMAMRRGLQWTKGYIKDVRPQILIVSFGVSEVLDVPQDYRYNQTTMRSLHGSKPGGLKRKLASISQIARRIRQWRGVNSQAHQERKANLETKNHFLNSLGQQRAIYEKMEFDSLPPSRQGRNDPMLEYMDGLFAFEKLAERVGAKLIVVGEPSLHDNSPQGSEFGRLKRPRWEQYPSASNPQGRGLRPDPGWVENELNRYYRAADDWCIQTGVAFVSLNDDFTLAKNVNHFLDDMTLTLEGSRVVANVMTPVVSRVVEKILAD